MPKVRTGILLVAAVAALAGPSSGAQRLATLGPARSGSLGVDYTIAFWTIPFGRTSFDVHFENAAYRIGSHFETRGIISALWNATIERMHQLTGDEGMRWRLEKAEWLLTSDDHDRDSPQATHHLGKS